MKAPLLSATALVASSLLLSAFSCGRENEDACPSREIAGAAPQFYPCILNQRSDATQLFVVNSASEFSQTFSCSSYRPRDAVFRDSTLLVGWKRYTDCGRVKSQHLLYSCASGTYTYQVELAAGVCTAITPVTSQLLVHRLPAGAKVVLDMR